MRFAISIPQVVPDGGFDPAGLRAYLTRAEEIGFQSAWTQEAILGVAPILSPLELMTFAAACIHQLRLGCAVFVSPLHSPLYLTKSISTLDQISHGRTEVGIALGGRARMPDAFGVDADSLTSWFVEGLKLMKACWSESSITFAGRFWQFEGISMEPKPFQKPHPPLWIGGSHPEAVMRAARYGDGFFGTGASTTTQFAQQVRIIRQVLKTYGRDDAHFQIAKRVYIAINDDVVGTRERVCAALVQFYGVSGLPGLPDLSTLVIYGPLLSALRG